MTIMLDDAVDINAEGKVRVIYAKLPNSNNISSDLKLIRIQKWQTCLSIFKNVN